MMADILNQIQEIVEQKDMVIQDLQRELKQKDEEIRQLKDCLNVSVTAHQKVEKQLAKCQKELKQWMSNYAELNKIHNEGIKK